MKRRALVTGAGGFVGTRLTRFLETQGWEVVRSGHPAVDGMLPCDFQDDNAVRALIIKAPRNGDAAAQKVAVSGIAPIGVKVSANGQPLTLDAKARFSGQVAPMPGSRVVFRVVVNGVETYVVRWLGRGGSR